MFELHTNDEVFLDWEGKRIVIRVVKRLSHSGYRLAIDAPLDVKIVRSKAKDLTDRHPEKERR